MLLTQFWKLREGFCEEVMSKRVIKDEWKSARERTRDGRWGEELAGELRVGRVLHTGKEYGQGLGGRGWEDTGGRVEKALMLGH